jgi:hypothetical protein
MGIVGEDRSALSRQQAKDTADAAALP